MPEADTTELLEDHRKRRVQEIVGSLLYYAQAVDNNFLVALSGIAAHQSCATVATEQAVHLLLDYVATYPSDGIIYRSSGMILYAHADAGFLNKTNSRSCAGAHIYLSENDPFPLQRCSPLYRPKNQVRHGICRQGGTRSTHCHSAGDDPTQANPP